MNKKIRTMTIIAMIAAIYTVVSIALAPISYGNIQVRIAEALTLLPVIFAPAIGGVTLGCALTNLIGVFMGANILGFVDVFVGTLATFLAAVCSYKLRNIRWKNVPILSALMPVLFNALFIGLELAFVFFPGDAFWMGFGLSALEVGFGELLSCFVLGIPLIVMLKKTKIFSNHGI